MAETLTRAEWLRLELAAAHSYVERFASSDDPIEQVQVARRRREASAIREELDRLEGGPTVRFRMSGPAIEGSNAPTDLVKEIVQHYGEIADEYGAGVLVAPATSGSHVIEFVSPAQGQLPTFDSFSEAAEAVIGLSPDTMEPGDTLEAHALVHAADLTTPTLLAVRGIVSALAKHRVDAEVDLDAPERSAFVRFQRAVANDLERILKDLHRDVRHREIHGLLRGFTALGGRFEIEAESLYKGQVPKALRAAANGIPLGSAVTAVIEQITTTLQSGDERVRFRLNSIAAAE